MRPITEDQSRASRIHRTFAACAALTLLGGACEGTAADAGADVQIDVAPNTLEQAGAELGRANDMLAARPQDTRLRADAQILRDSMDRLSGMIARIDISADHAVIFYKHADGSA